MSPSESNATVSVSGPFEKYKGRSQVMAPDKGQYGEYAF